MLRIPDNQIPHFIKLFLTAGYSVVTPHVKQEVKFLEQALDCKHIDTVR